VPGAAFANLVVSHTATAAISVAIVPQVPALLVGAGELAETPAVSNVTSTAIQQIGEWESEFFDHHYSGDPAASRIGRIEQLVFGAVQKGTDDERVERLKNALNQAESTNPAIPTGVAETNTVPHQSGTRPANANAGATTIAVSPVTGKVSSITAAEANPDQDPVRAPTLTVTKKAFATVLKPEKIIQNLSEAIRENPKDAELMFQRGKAYIQVDKLDRALSDISDAIMFQPNRSDFYLARAWVYHLEGNGVMSDLDIKQAQFVDPRFPGKIVWGK
jgi:tetratricopeptide (TPR) repeat protein